MFLKLQQVFEEIELPINTFQNRVYDLKLEYVPWRYLYQMHHRILNMELINARLFKHFVLWKNYNNFTEGD